MGFLFHMIELPKLTFIWRHVKLMVIVSLTRLGLYKSPPEEDDVDSGYNPNSYILILDGTCPSLVTVPIEVATAAVKLKVPILLYSDYLLLRRGNCGQLVNRCSICLESMELDEEVRELITCSHVFHRECLDTWVNDGHVTCPLCRSMLLPPKLISCRYNSIKPFISASDST